MFGVVPNGAQPFGGGLRRDRIDVDAAPLLVPGFFRQARQNRPTRSEKPGALGERTVEAARRVAENDVVRQFRRFFRVETAARTFERNDEKTID